MEWKTTECEASVQVECQTMESFKVMNMTVSVSKELGSDTRYHIALEIAGREIMLDLNRFESMTEAREEVKSLLAAIQCGCKRLLEGDVV